MQQDTSLSEKSDVRFNDYGHSVASNTRSSILIDASKSDIRKTRLVATILFAVLLITIPLNLWRNVLILPCGFTAQQPANELCPQVAELIPNLHGDLWRDLDATFRNNAFTDRAADLLGAAVRVPTQVYDDMALVGADSRWDIFGSFHNYLANNYPKIHATLSITKVNTYGLVYHWQGTDATLRPLLLTAHQDVVPVNPETYSQWVHPPFSGYYDGEFIWGRGSIDDKAGLVSLMAGIELLLERGFEPSRTVVVAMGFDEEASGLEGAGKLAQHLLTTYGENAFAMLVDEGGEIQEQYGAVVALPAIAEKGYLDVRLTVSAPGGHSSVPPVHTTIGILAQLLVHYENSAPEARLSRDSPMYTHAQCLAAHAPKVPSTLRKAITQSATSDKALRAAQDELFKDPDFKAVVGTTQAIDLISGGVKSNALPENAMAVINHRIATDSSAKAVQEHATQILQKLVSEFNMTFTAFGENVTGNAPGSGHVVLSDAWGTELEPAPITSVGDDAASFKLLAGTIKSTYNSHRSLNRDRIVVIPSLGSGNTDTQFYWKLTPNIFRYTHYKGGDGSGLERIHTVNEACKADSFVEMIRFYVTLILNADEYDL